MCRRHAKVRIGLIYERGCWENKRMNVMCRGGVGEAVHSNMKPIVSQLHLNSYTFT